MLGYSHAFIAAQCGVSETVARSWERKGTPGLIAAAALALLFGCPLRDLLVPNLDRRVLG